MNPFEKVYENLGLPTVLTLMGENAVSLAHAAIELRRTLTGRNRNPADIIVARGNLYAEIASMQNFLTVLDAGGEINKEAVENLRKIRMAALTKAAGGGI